MKPLFKETDTDMRIALCGLFWFYPNAKHISLVKTWLEESTDPRVTDACVIVLLNFGDRTAHRMVRRKLLDQDELRNPWHYGALIDQGDQALSGRFWTPPCR